MKFSDNPEKNGSWNRDAHDGTDEVLPVLRRANLELGHFIQELLLESILPQRRRHIQTGQRGALLALILKRSSHALHNGILHLRRGMYQVEVLSSRLAHKSWVTLVDIDIGGDILPQFLEHECAAGEVESCEAWVRDDLGNNFGGRSGDELNDARRHACFFENLVDQIIGVGGSRRRLPHDGISNKSRS